ncbi:MAG TPA: GAF domain-containing protein [Elusimicrobiota bacterium]|nr:GAF domain-containing protein [Elusimicrobiota bacterium]
MADTKSQSGELLFSSLRAMEYQVSAILQVSNFIRSIDDYEKVLSNVLKKVVELSQADAGLILVPVPANNEFRIFMSHSTSLSPQQLVEMEERLKGVHLGIMDGIAGQIYISGEPVLLPNINGDTVFKKDLAASMKYEVKDLLAVPLQMDDCVVGVLELFNKQPAGSVFSPQDLSLVTTLSNPIALVLEAHRLRSQSSSQVQQLNLLLKSLEIVNSSLSLDITLDNLMTMGVQLVDAEASSILLMDDELGQLYFAAATGVKKEEMKKVYLKKGEGIAGWVADRGETLLIPDVSKDPRFSKKADKSSGFVTKSILAVPIKTEGRLIGVAEAINKKGGGEFNDMDAQIFATLSSYGAMAIQKAQLYRDVNELFMATLRALADAIEAKDATVRGRTERIRRLCMVIAEELKLGEKDQRDVELAALLHDVGKIAVPDSILNKQENLTDEEYKVLMRVPVVGAEILSPIRQLRSAIPGIRHYQERWDGKGYPDRLSGENIPVAARIIAVSSTFEAMTSDRPYRKGLPDDVALKEMATLAGVQFDPACVEAFIRGYRKGKLKNLLK